MDKEILFKRKHFLRSGDELDYGYVQTQAGKALIILYDDYLIALAFIGEQSQSAVFDEMAHWVRPARLVESADKIKNFMNETEATKNAPLLLIGTLFQHKVWQALLSIPQGRQASYKDIAKDIHNHKASRAVGSAIGRNPISWHVPCHRVIRSDGDLGGYRWGLSVKKRLRHFEGLTC